MVRTEAVFMLSVVAKVPGNGVATFGLAPVGFCAVNNWAVSILLARLSVFPDHLKVLDLQRAEVLLQL